MRVPTRMFLLLVLQAVALAVFAAPPCARMAGDAAVRLDSDDARLSFVIFEGRSYNRVLETLNEKAVQPGDGGALEYTFVRHGKLRGTGRCVTKPAGNGLVVRHDITSHGELKGDSIGFLLKLPAETFATLKYACDGKEAAFPEKRSRLTVASGSVTKFTVAFPGKRTWTLAFPKAVDYAVQDTRCDEKDDFVVCFFIGGRFSLTAGKGLDASCTLTSDGGKVQGGVRGFHGIGEGDDWVKLNWVEEIKPTSALDFSRGAHRRLPAGGDGRLMVTTNGTFVFSRRQDVEQRFFGVALSSDAAFPQKAEAAALAKNLARSGYNSVRLRSFDGKLVHKEPKKGFVCDPDLAVRLDQFVGNCEREGLYLAYDITSRHPYSWSDLKIAAPTDRDPSDTVSLALFLLNDQAYGTWQELARLIYGRKNKTMSRTYCEDPGVPLVFATSEGGMFGPWNELRALPFVRDAYADWLKAARAKDPSFLEGRVCEIADLGVMALHEQKALSIRRFLCQVETNALARQRAFLGTLKSKALVGAVNSALWYGDVAQDRSLGGDFTTFAFDYDCPRQLGVKWSYPYRLDNRNPLKSQYPITRSLAQHSPSNRAFCVTSWSAPSPSMWRAPLGLLVGATAGRDGWSGVWRVLDGHDPMSAALERAVYALYVRGDMPLHAPKEAFSVDEERRLVVNCERTAGGFAPTADGKIVAGPLTAELKGFHAAVWVSSLDMLPVAKSKRLLLTHLTDMQSLGSLFADSRRDLLMARGKGGVAVRNGSARITLAVDKPSAFKVFALGTDGTRGAAVPVETTADGKLAFTASVRGAKGAQYLYELVRR